MVEMYLGSDRPGSVLIQAVDLSDIDLYYETVKLVESHTGRLDLGFCALCCQKPRDEMGPWEAGPFPDGWFSFGYGRFTLEDLKKHVIDPIRSKQFTTRFYIGGCGLSGLFALWATYQLRDFSGAACISPSVWFPGFQQYAEENQPLTKRIYLEIDRRETHVREPVRRFNARNALEELCDKLVTEDGVDSILEVTESGRKNCYAERTARGFEWLLSRES